jgi:hypothetical protein
MSHALDELREGFLLLDGTQTYVKVLSPLMRSYFDASQAHPITVSTTNTPSLATQTNQQHQVDHFIEIQHAIRIFMQYAPKGGPYGQNLFDFPVGEFLRLSQFLNHEYNLYSIPSTLNNYKSRITVGFYTAAKPPHGEAAADSEKRVFMQNYMNATVVAHDGTHTTVRNRVALLLVAMKDAEGDYTYLSKLVGKTLLDLLGNDNPGFQVLARAGAFFTKPTRYPSANQYFN